MESEDSPTFSRLAPQVSPCCKWQLWQECSLSAGHWACRDFGGRNNLTGKQALCGLFSPRAPGSPSTLSLRPRVILRAHALLATTLVHSCYCPRVPRLGGSHWQTRALADFESCGAASWLPGWRLAIESFRGKELSCPQRAEGAKGPGSSLSAHL